MNHSAMPVVTGVLKRIALPLTVVALGALGACSTTPDRNAALDQARARLDAARSQPNVAALAPEELARADAAMRSADMAHTGGAKVAEIDHLAYLTSQRVTLSQEAAAARGAQAVTAKAGAERDRMRLELRTAEADAAQRQLSASAQSNDRKTQQLAQASASSQADRERLASRDAQVGDLQAQLKELNARPTPRGMVVTLGDVLFDTGRSQLKGEGDAAMVKLARFMSRDPQRKAAIEGYTDSVGSSAANLALADRRARSVRSALLELGVGGERLSTRAFGEENPIGDNATAAGRQMNRRVELVFSPGAGDLLVD